MNIKFKKFNKDAIIPTIGTDYSAGSDLSACIKENIIIPPKKIKIIDTGIGIEIPNGFFGMVCPRSGLSAKHGISILNTPGIIDSDYRGEIKCILINHFESDFIVENKMRIAQIIIVPFQKPIWIESKELSDSIRGKSGFGSTGL